MRPSLTWRATRLLQLGVQDILATPCDTAALARGLRLAIERKRMDLQARKAYATDLSTGLPNHAQLLEHMTHLVALRAREPAPMCLIVLRIEGLVQTEAALGVEAANVLKRKVAVRLRSGLRASDVVASIGGDAFAVLLAWIDAPDDGERVASKLAASLTQPFSVVGRERHVGVRVGLVILPPRSTPAGSRRRRRGTRWTVSRSSASASVVSPTTTTSCCWAPTTSSPTRGARGSSRRSWCRSTTGRRSRRSCPTCGMRSSARWSTALLGALAE